jgi:two-component system chemotaxis response regulator CheY
VLIVDDTMLTRRMLADILEEGGHRVVGEAEDGDAAVELFQRERPDVTLLDLVLPGVDGAAVLQRMLHVSAEARVVVMTASQAREHCARALNAGACGLLPKPFTPDEVLRAVEEAATPRA